MTSRLFTRFDDVGAALKDHDTFSSTTISIPRRTNDLLPGAAAVGRSRRSQVRGRGQDRARPRHQSGRRFGLGVHRCLGGHIARMELRVGLEEFFAAVPEFRLVDPDAVTWKPGPIRGPREFELEF